MKSCSGITDIYYATEWSRRHICSFGVFGKGHLKGVSDNDYLCLLVPRSENHTSVFIAGGGYASLEEAQLNQAFSATK